MRIRRLDLSRYGNFTDRSIELPAGEFDFHVIFGPNEAGKSTIRNAVADLLYGIPAQSPYRFVHAYSEMCIGALIEDGGQSLDFKRLKRNKGSLVDAHDKPLPDNALVPFVMDTDRDFFLRMFALSHQELIAGGREILDSSGDLGQMLFQAAAGLRSFQTIKARLDEEADSLWGPRAKDSRAYTKALGRLEEAKAKLHSVQVTKGKWATARRALDEAEDLLARANSDSLQLAVDRDRLDRIRRVSPLLVQLADATGRLVELGSVTRLPENAASTLNEAAVEIAAATAQSHVHRETIREATLKLADLVPDLRLLSHSSEVQRLAALIANVVTFERDIPKREMEVAQQKSALLTAAREVGWIDVSHVEVVARLPSRLLRADIEGLIGRYATVKGTLAQRSSVIAREESTLQAIADELATVPDVVEHPELSASLLAVQSLNLDERRERLSAETDAAERKLTEALSNLLPWTGNETALTSLCAPAPSEVQRILDARRNLELEAAKVRQSISDREIEMAGLDVRLKQERRANTLVTANELLDARTRRDTTFAGIVAGNQSPAEAAPAYSSEVLEADSLADRRFEGADAAAALQVLVNTVERLQAEVTRLVGQRADYEDRLKALDLNWTSLTSEAGLAGISLDRMPQWLQQLSAGIEAELVLEQCRDRASKFASRASTCLDVLRAELQNAAADVAQDSGNDTLLRLATAVLSSADQGRARGELLKKQQRDCQSKLAAARDEQANAEAEMATWQREWDAGISQANLPAESTTVAGAAAMEAFRAMDTCLDKVRSLEEERIGPMRRDVSLFEKEVASLVASSAPDLASRPSKDAIGELTGRLAKAKAEQSDRDRLVNEIATSEKNLTRCEREGESAHLKLQPLYEQAAIANIDELRPAIARSDQARALDRTIGELRASAIRGGSGLTLEELEREVESTDLPQLSAELDAVKRRLVESDNHREVLLERRALARDEYSKIAGSDEAAKAESRRQAAFTDMGTAANEYIRVCTGAHLLRWALERYREEKQGPLLARASQYFADLTNGQHAKLLVEANDAVRLISRRADGSTVGVEGMSDGTSDQLYLALRLAALEMRLEESSPMPFIADDLLINCDDERAASSLAAFERMASKTQVLYFTHHKHLIDLARGVSNNRVNVVEI